MINLLCAVHTKLHTLSIPLGFLLQAVHEKIVFTQHVSLIAVPYSTYSLAPRYSQVQVIQNQVIKCNLTAKIYEVNMYCKMFPRLLRPNVFTRPHSDMSYSCLVFNAESCGRLRLLYSLPELYHFHVVSNFRANYSECIQEIYYPISLQERMVLVRPEAFFCGFSRSCPVVRA